MDGAHTSEETRKFRLVHLERSVQSDNDRGLFTTLHNRVAEPIKIFHLVGSLEVGGTEKGILLTVPRLNRDRFLSVVCSITPRMPLQSELESQGIRTYTLGIDSRWDIRLVGGLLKLLRKERPDVLHSYLFHANMVSRVVGRLARVPIILNSERSVNQDGGFRMFVNHRTHRLATAVETNSEAGKSYVLRGLGADPSKVFVVHQGVDTLNSVSQDASGVRRALGLDPEALVVGFVGRLHPVKGLSYCVRAFSTVVRELPEARLVLVGDGPERAQLERLCDVEGVFDRVLFLGQRPDVAQIMSAMDVLVLPSLAEGLSRVVLEAMAMGKPVVATRVGGQSEAVVDGATGLLVPPAEPGALAQALLKVLSDRTVARQMGAEGRARVDSWFSVDHAVSRYEKLYPRLLASGR